MTTSYFGAHIIKWGEGDEEARLRMSDPSLTREYLESWGVTVAIARAWQERYYLFAEENPNGPKERNPSAQGRLELMRCVEKILLNQRC